MESFHSHHSPRPFGFAQGGLDPALHIFIRRVKDRRV
jgi:hypothetical protein